MSSQIESGSALAADAGTFRFSENRFSQPPVVTCQIIRNGLNITKFVTCFVNQITKYYFSYSLQGKLSGDVIQWTAVNNMSN